jgi:hypothetical protein
MRLRSAIVGIFVGTSLLVAQDVISAKAGFVNYQEGHAKTDRHQLQEGERFLAESGRTEVLLTPGVFLRLERNGEINMLSSSLLTPRVELLDGTAGVEVSEVAKDSRITLTWRDKTFVFRHKGLYRFDASGNHMVVSTYDGELDLPSGLTLKKGHRVEVTPAGFSSAMNFDRKALDSFDLWSSERSYELSAASYRAANTYRNLRLPSSMWIYNSFLGAYTFMPYGGYMYSPWGYPYYSPRTVWVMPRGGYGSGSGSGVGSGSGSGYSAGTPYRGRGADMGSGISNTTGGGGASLGASHPAPPAMSTPTPVSGGGGGAAPRSKQ